MTPPGIQPRGKFRPLVLFNACEVGAATELLGGMGGRGRGVSRELFSRWRPPPVENGPWLASEDGVPYWEIVQDVARRLKVRGIRKAPAIDPARPPVFH